MRLPRSLRVFDSSHIAGAQGKIRETPGECKGSQIRLGVIFKAVVDLKRTVLT
jgi:hypothetical protein